MFTNTCKLPHYIETHEMVGIGETESSFSTLNLGVEMTKLVKYKEYL